MLHHKCCFGLAIGLENLGLPKAVVNMMMSFPNHFLCWDVAQAMLQNRGQALTILRFCSKLDMASAPVGESLLKMCQYTKQHQSWIWDVYLAQKGTFKGMQRGLVASFMRQPRHVQAERDLIQQMVNGIENVVSRKALEIKHRSFFTPEEQVRMVAECE